MRASSSSCPGRQETAGFKLALQTGLPLVPCPECGEEVLELVAGPGSKVPGAVFFMCRFHDRDDPSSCPWYLFADKYKRMLMRKGIIGGTIVGTEPPQFQSEVGGLVDAAVDRDNGVPLLSEIGGLDAKLKQLVTLGHIGVACTLVIAVFVVLGVIILLVNRN